MCVKSVSFPFFTHESLLAEHRILVLKLFFLGTLKILPHCLFASGIAIWSP